MAYIGFGTWKVPDNSQGDRIIQGAVAAGYRHFDSAERYANESMLGRALRSSGMARQDFTVTGKVWKTHMGYDRTLKACENSLKMLGFDSFDCYLIHWPEPITTNAAYSENVNSDTWRALERMHDEGLVKKIGVANFMRRHLEPLLLKANIKPEINQLEIHPGCIQTDAIACCREYGIELEAWSPLGSGDILKIPELMDMADRHDSTTAEVCLNWLLQQNISPIVRSFHSTRMYQNLHGTRFVLDAEELATITAIPQQGDLNGMDPDTLLL